MTCVVALLLLSWGSATAQARSPSLADVARVDYWDSLSAEERKGVQNWLGKLRDYEPYAPDAGGSYKRRIVARELDEVIRARIAANGHAPEVVRNTHSGTVRAAQSTGIWPKLGVSKAAGTKIVTRAIPGAAGAWVLWEIGCRVGAVCKRQPVQVNGATPATTTAYEARFAGPYGSCIGKNGSTSPSSTLGAASVTALTSANEASYCAPFTFAGETVTPVKVPAGALYAVWRAGAAGSTSLLAAQRCFIPAGSPHRTTSHVTDTGFTGPVLCTSTDLQLGAGGWVEKRGVYHDFGNPYKSEKFACRPADAPVNANTCDWTYSYHAATRSWVLDFGFGETLEPPRDGDHPDWAGDTTTRIQTDLPAEPAPGALETATAEAVEEDSPQGDALRDAITETVDVMLPDSSGSWGDSTYDGYSVSFPMPDCVGGTADACSQLLAQAGHTGSRNGTVLDFEGADLTKPAGAIVTTSPPAGATLTPEAPVTWTRNPDPAAMPRAVPAPQPGETHQAYVARLEEQGLLGKVTILTDATMDAEAGTDAVVNVNPSPGTRVAPGTEVTVQANPPTAPPYSGGSGGGIGSCDEATVRAINWAPLAGMGLSDVFPFGIVGWLLDVFSSWTAGGAAPVFDVPIPGSGDGLHVDLSIGQPVLDVLRPVFLITALVGFVWFLASLTLGIGSRGSDD